jgi:hypothetical protein
MAMTTLRRWLLWSLLAGVLPSCGGDGGGGGLGETCLALTITYGGSKSGAAYYQVMFADGGQYAGGSPSIQLLMATENGFRHCVQRGPGDISFTGVTWIDVSGTANCADLSSLQCQPTATDPQAHQNGVERWGQTTQVPFNVVD